MKLVAVISIAIILTINSVSFADDVLQRFKPVWHKGQTWKMCVWSAHGERDEVLNEKSSPSFVTMKVIDKLIINNYECWDIYVEENEELNAKLSIHYYFKCNTLELYGFFLNIIRKDGTKFRSIPIYYDNPGPRYSSVGCIITAAFPYFGNPMDVKDSIVSVKVNPEKEKKYLVEISLGEYKEKCYQYWVPGDPWWRESYIIDLFGTKCSWTELVCDDTREFIQSKMRKPLE